MFIFKFKLNPLICCGRDGGGPGESDTSDAGGSSGGGGENEGGGKSGGSDSHYGGGSHGQTSPDSGDSDGGGFLDQLTGFLDQAIDTTVDVAGNLLDSFFGIEVEGGVKDSAGKKAGDAAYALGIGEIGQIAAEADKAALDTQEGRDRALQDQLAIAHIAEDDDLIDALEKDLSVSGLWGYNKTVAQNQLSMPGWADLALAVSPLPTKSMDLIGLTAAAVGTISGRSIGNMVEAGFSESDQGREDYTQDPLSGGDVVTDSNIVDINNIFGDSFDIDDDQTDLIGQLSRQLGIDRTPVSFRIGNQKVTKVPQSQRDELATMLEYLLSKERNLTGQDAIDLRRDLEEPSTVDKVTQGVGVASDLIGLGTTIGSFF